MFNTMYLLLLIAFTISDVDYGKTTIFSVKRFILRWNIYDWFVAFFLQVPFNNLRYSIIGDELAQIVFNVSNSGTVSLRPNINLATIDEINYFVSFLKNNCYRSP